MVMTMDYEQKYKAALEWMQGMYGGLHGKTKEEAEKYFPELKESEDDRIRGAIIDHLKDNNLTEWAAWLEKQGEQKPSMEGTFVNVDEVREDFMQEVYRVLDADTTNDRANQIIDAFDNLPTIAIQKPADKVEPKFKVEAKFHEGEWITNGDYTWKILMVKFLCYVLQSQGGNVVEDTIPHVDEQFHFFTIEDAKTGDVLASELCDSIILFKGINDDNNIDFYCDYDFSEIDVPGDRFSVNNGQHYGNVEDSKDFHPATKEQRDTLMKAVADAGYIFDFEKKELKKIEQEPAWSKEDEYRTEKLLGWINTLINYIHEDAMVSLDLRMERIQQVEQIKTWLKSLRPQKQWKPSEEQIASITCAVRKMKESACYDSELVSLFNDLKKLKG